MMKMVHLSKKAPSSSRRRVWKSRWGIAVLFCALAVSFSSCDLLQDLGLVPEDESAEEPDPGPEPPAKGEPVDGAAGMFSIKDKFGVTLDGTEGVAATFNELSAYIQAGGLEYEDNVIQLGDWIDLEGGLQVAAYPGSDGNGGGGFTRPYQDTDEYTGDERLLLRLIVVGINSFHSGRGMADSDTITQNGDTNGQYAVTDNDNTPHVVFQFQNVPVARRMNPNETDITGGYAGSEMREYLVPLEGKEGSGRFLAGLTEAGVPDDVLWAPKRFVSVKGEDGPGEISDLLWLPTERELFGGNTNSASADETAANQARLEYYDSQPARVKTNPDPGWRFYWEASPNSGLTPGFCRVFDSGAPGVTFVNRVYGCAPAFCVR
jgi:hypothetical protein